MELPFTSGVQSDENAPIHMTRSKKRSYSEQDQSDRVDPEVSANDRQHRTAFDNISHSNVNGRCIGAAKRPKSSLECTTRTDDSKENFSIGLHAAGLLAATEDRDQSSHVTPTKSRKLSDEDPLTPTTNLKVLLSAISPALRDREARRRKELLFDDNQSEKKAAGSDDDIEKTAERTKRPEYSRKDKSLARLCSRFLDLFDKEENVGQKILLDSAATQLGVERRRVYDIINVLESLEIAKREAKNQYLWKGRSQLPATVTKLKAHALQKGLMPKMDLQQSEELSVEKIRANIHKLPDGKSGSMSIVSDSETEESVKEPNMKVTCKRFPNLFERRDRSLGCLTQRFLMLFFVSDTRIVGLDVAALILIGNMSPESATWKTKVRRLYDIANILSSLDLIKKVRLPLRYGMKPAYQWVGTELDTAAQQYVAAERLPTASRAPARRRSYSKKHTLIDGFEAIPLPKSESTDVIGSSQNLADLSGPSQSEACLSTETGASTELQMASALMQLKTGQPVLPITTKCMKSVLPSTQVTTTLTTSSDSTVASRPTVLTVMQTSVLPSGQSLLVPMATKSSHQAASTIFLSTAGLDSNNKPQQTQVASRQPTKPILLSFLPSTQFPMGATVSAIPVFHTAVPLTTSKTTTPISHQCEPDSTQVRPSTAIISQPFTVLPNSTFSSVSKTVLPEKKQLLSQTVVTRSGPGLKPIAPKGSPPSNGVSVADQLHAIRELLAQDNEAYETLMEKQRQNDQEDVSKTGTETLASPIVSSMSTSGMAFPVKALLLSSPNVQSVSMAQLSSPRQQIEHLHNEIKQQSGVSWPSNKPLHFHQYTPRKQSKDSLQFHQFKSHKQCGNTLESALATSSVSKFDGDSTLLSPYLSDQLTCREQLSPATPQSASCPLVGSKIENGFHAKPRQRILFYPCDSKEEIVEKMQVRSQPTPNQINALRFPTIFQHQSVSESVRPSVPVISSSHVSSLPSVSSLSAACDMTHLSDCKPFASTESITQEDFWTIADQSQNGSGLLGICPLWNFSSQRHL